MRMNKTRVHKTWGLGSILIACLCAPVPALAESRAVVATILPIHSLVAGLVDGIHEAELLLPTSASPHGYAMRPTEARRLQNADLLVWVGPELETFLEGLLSESRSTRTVIGLMDDLDLELLSTREGGVWEPHLHDQDPGDDHGHGNDHAHGHDHGEADDHERDTDKEHDHGKTHDRGHGSGHDHENDHGAAHAPHSGAGDPDAHVWLSPENARRIVSGLSDRLSAWDPVNTTAYEANRDALMSRIDALDAELQEQLAPVRDRAFIVFHDAYQYFEHYYRLNAAGSITVDPAQAPGARRIQELRDRLQGDDVVCLFTEPQFRPNLATVLVEGRSTRLGELDPLGTGLEAGPDAWFQLMRGMADGLTDCLGSQDR